MSVSALSSTLLRRSSDNLAILSVNVVMGVLSP